MTLLERANDVGTNSARALQGEAVEFQGKVNVGSHFVSLLPVFGDKWCENQMV